jgi:hypothetical protein
VFGFAGPAAAQALSQKPDKGARAAAGTILQYEEAAGANVIYLEEKGGMVSAVAPPVAPPVAAKRDVPPAPATRRALAKAPAKAAEGAGKLATSTRALERP